MGRDGTRDEGKPGPASSGDDVRHPGSVPVAHRSVSQNAGQDQSRCRRLPAELRCLPRAERPRRRTRSATALASSRELGLARAYADEQVGSLYVLDHRRRRATGRFRNAGVQANAVEGRHLVGHRLRSRGPGSAKRFIGLGAQHGTPHRQMMAARPTPEPRSSPCRLDDRPTISFVTFRCHHQRRRGAPGWPKRRRPCDEFRNSIEVRNGSTVAGTGGKLPFDLARYQTPMMDRAVACHHGLSQTSAISTEIGT